MAIRVGNVGKVAREGAELLTWYNEKMNVDRDLVRYVESNIFPKYDRFYSHGMIHVNNVIDNMMMLADYYNLDADMAYAIAAYHDSGLGVDRENHEYESGKILATDAELKKHFSDEQIKIMQMAIEDHRGSRKERPRNFYGECISDSDRDFDIYLLVKRQISTSIKHYPDYNFEQHFENCYNYICKRINKSGKFNLWTNNPILVKRRDKFQKEYLDKASTKRVYKKEWDTIYIILDL